jgi:hypothetical protein
MLTRTLTILLASLVLSLAAAQRCLPELSADATPGDLAATASAEDAAMYLRRAVELLEPALPVLMGGPDTHGLVPGEPGFDDALYLASRLLLPASWAPGELGEVVWADMLQGVAAMYAVVAPAPSGLSRGELIRDLSLLIDRAVPTLDPVVLIAASGSDPSRIGFLAIIRNDSVYPRLIVMRPPAGAFDLSRGPTPVLPALETCAMPLERFISAREETATRLYLANSEARMVVVDISSSPQFAPHWVEAGEELDYLRLAHPYTASLDRFSVVFVGPGPAMTTVLRIIPQLRTNMSPREIVQFVLDR